MAASVKIQDIDIFSCNTAYLFGEGNSNLKTRSLVEGLQLIFSAVGWLNCCNSESFKWAWDAWGFFQLPQSFRRIPAHRLWFPRRFSSKPLSDLKWFQVLSNYWLQTWTNHSTVVFHTVDGHHLGAWDGAKNLVNNGIKYLTYQG